MNHLDIRPLLDAELAQAQALARACNVYIPNGKEILLLGAFSAASAQNLLGFAAWQSVLDEATLLGIAVHEEARGQHIGRQLLAYSEAALPDIRDAFLEVRAGNRAAQALYRTSGYQSIALRRAYYGDEDAIVMHKIFSHLDST